MAAERCPFKTTAAGFICIKDRAVSHPVLKNLPYEHAAEAWVRACFPDAVYHCSDATCISIPHADAEGVLAIQGAKGLGKSKFIAGLIAGMPETTTVLFITFQISLAHGSLHVLGPRGKLYSQQEGCLLPVEHPRLCVVINSLARVEPGYDVVVIDELVSVINQLTSAQLITPSLRTTILVHLHAILKRARRVIVADAMLDASCLRFLLSCCLETAVDTDDADVDVGADAGADGTTSTVSAPKQLWVHDFTHRPHDDYVYVAHAGESTWKEALQRELQKGRNVVVACMTKRQAELLREEYAAKVLTYCYTGDDSEVLSKQMLEGVDKHWDKCRLLVYSPVITAGCSFERKHFHSAFFYGKCNLASARTAIQMLSRVRDISEKRVHVFLSQFGGTDCALGYAPLPETEASAASDTFETRLCTQAHTLKEHHLDLLRQLDEFKEREQLICKTAFPYYFWLLAVNSGASITFEYEQGYSALLASYRGKLLGNNSGDGLEGPEFVVGVEKHLAHAWDARCYKEYSVYTGKMLQRAGALHADRATALHMLAGVKISVQRLSSEPLGVGRWRDARCLAWVVLVAQRALVMASVPSLGSALCSNAETGAEPDGTESKPLQVFRKVVTTAQIDCQSCIRPYTTTVFPAAIEFAACQPPDLRVQVPLKGAFLGYYNFNPDTASAVNITTALEDAWLLAALDTSVRTPTGVPVTARTLGVPRPCDLDGDCAKRIAAAVTEALDSLFVETDAKREDANEAWVGLNVIMGSGTGVAIVDAAVVCRGVWNVLIFRASGSAKWAYDFDVIKGLALMSRVPPSHRRGVMKLVYLESGQIVTVDASTWGASTALKNHLDSKKGLEHWEPSRNVAFAYLHAEGVEVLVSRGGGGGEDEGSDGDGDDGYSFQIKTYKTLRDAFEDPDGCIEEGCKVVTWGFRDYFNSDYEKRACDLEYALVANLKVPPTQLPGTVIPIASVSPVLKDATSLTGVRRLRFLYQSAVKKCALLWFLNDCPPKCVDIYSIPSVQFLTRERVTETHEF